MTLMIIQLLIVLLALYVGSRYGSLALGAISGIGLAILVLGFGLQPGKPPTDVIYIIIAAVTCAGIMQASGGMDWLIQIAERLLRKHPNHITILAPLCTFFLTVLVGTGHVVYTLMPIICDISLKKGIRPERPCGVASVASQVGITCSPIAAAVASFVIISNANGFEVNNLQVIAITIPACICGLMAAAAVSYKRGLDLDKDPAFQARLKDPQMKEYMYGSTASVVPDYRPRYPPAIPHRQGRRRRGTGKTARHEHHHPDCDDNGGRVHDYLLQGEPQKSRLRRRVAKWHGRRCRHLRNRLACRHLLRELHGRDAGRPQGHRAALPVGHRVRGACSSTHRAPSWSPCSRSPTASASKARCSWACCQACTGTSSSRTTPPISRP